MAEKPSGWSDERMEMIMGNLLRTGVLIAALVVFAGGVLYLWRYGSAHPNYRIFRGEPSDLKGLHAIAEFALGEHSRGLIQLGLLLLIATPVARVVFAVYGFLRERDRLYVGVSLLVLAVLLYSLFWGKV